jgi:peptide/nickel transport system substrate-binding protein
LSFIAGQADVYFGVTFPQLQDVKREVPDAICDSFLVNGSRNLIVNRGAPPFDNPDLRRAMSLTLDRQAFIDIMGQGNGAIGGPMEPPPEGLWGMPAEMLKALPGYGPDVAQRRAEARQVMEKLGYGPDKRLAVTVAARNVPAEAHLADFINAYNYARLLKDKDSLLTNTSANAGLPNQNDSNSIRSRKCGTNT